MFGSNLGVLLLVAISIMSYGMIKFHNLISKILLGQDQDVILLQMAEGMFYASLITLLIYHSSKYELFRNQNLLYNQIRLFFNYDFNSLFSYSFIFGLIFGIKNKNSLTILLLVYDFFYETIKYLSKVFLLYIRLNVGIRYKILSAITLVFIPIVFYVMFERFPVIVAPQWYQQNFITYMLKGFFNGMILALLLNISVTRQIKGTLNI